jgi:hypothetical protein
MIIDGHHRYYALKDLGVKKIPATFIDYKDITIRTHNIKSLQLSKNNLIKNSLDNKLLQPKSTVHEVRTVDGSWKPIILVSNLAEIY